MDQTIGAVRRKARSTAARLPRYVARSQATAASYEVRRPILLTTVPKAGTHLASQILASFPGVRDWGTFVVPQSHALRYLGRSRDAEHPSVRRALSRVAPGELVRAHLGWHPTLREVLARYSYFTVLLVRDPRAIAVSNAHYIAATPWHPLNRAVRQLEHRERLEVVITGLGPGSGLPDIGTRLRKYITWADEASAVVRYEDLRERPEHAVATLAKSYIEDDPDRSGNVVAQALAAINPRASHTFRRGVVGGWRDELDHSLEGRIISLAREFMDRFGYR